MKKVNKILSLIAGVAGATTISFSGLAAQNALSTADGGLSVANSLTNNPTTQACVSTSTTLAKSGVNLATASRVYVPQTGGCGQAPKPKPKLEPTNKLCLAGLCVTLGN